jgi:hypothetical protein
MTELDDAWESLHAATPPGWFVGRQESATAVSESGAGSSPSQTQLDTPAYHQSEVAGGVAGGTAAGRLR